MASAKQHKADLDAYTQHVLTALLPRAGSGRHQLRGQKRRLRGVSVGSDASTASEPDVVAIFGFGSWLCENAKSHNGGRRSYSSETALGFQLASVFNLKSELKNFILVALRSSAFLHSQGH
jgi:hypothetical protein